MTIKEIIDNSIIIGTCFVFVIMIITYIIWYLKDKLNRYYNIIIELKRKVYFMEVNKMETWVDTWKEQFDKAVSNFEKPIKK